VSQAPSAIQGVLNTLKLGNDIEDISGQQQLVTAGEPIEA
jgi:hypothetical protein